MDISFKCNNCEQHIVIDNAGAGMSFQCPNCNTNLIVPVNQTHIPTVFYLFLNNRICGPFKQETIQCKITSGRLDSSTPCWRMEEETRKRIFDFQELMTPYTHVFDEDAVRSLFRLPQQINESWVNASIKLLSGPLQVRLTTLNEARVVSSRLIACNSIIKDLEQLLIYERLGFKTIQPLPSVAIADILGYRDDRVVKCLELECADREQKLGGLLTTKARANSMLKLLGTIDKYQAQIEDRGALDALRQAVFIRANHLRLDSELEAAKAFELSGENKKAIRALAKALAWASGLKVDDGFAEKMRNSSECLTRMKSGE